MNRLIEEMIKPILEANSNIKKVVGIYGGRFQPFGPHHLKTYKWLEKQVDVAYITTSNIKKPPKHPMNYKEKVRHMTKMGVPADRIIKEKIPYVATNTLKKYDKDEDGNEFCGGVPFFFNERTGKKICGNTSFEKLKVWAEGK